MNTDHFEPRRDTTALKHGATTDAIIGAFYNVYNELGHGFLESVYRAGLALVLAERGLKSPRTLAIPLAALVCSTIRSMALFWVSTAVWTAWPATSKRNAGPVTGK